MVVFDLFKLAERILFENISQKKQLSRFQNISLFIFIYLRFNFNLNINAPIHVSIGNVIFLCCLISTVKYADSVRR